MSIDIFSTRSMLGLVSYIYPVRTPFLDMFFKEIKKSISEYIDIDFVRGTRKLAPFVSPTVKGRMIEKRSFERRSVKPPYIKIKDVTTAADLLKTQPGEHIYMPGKTGRQLAREELAKQLKTFMDMIERRLEYMAVQALSTYGDITFSGDGITLTVNFNMQSTHKVTLAGTAKWSDTTNSTPLKDIRTWHTLVKKDSGLVPDVLIFDEDAAQYFIDHPTVSGPNSVFDTRRVDRGEINPRMLPSGLEYIGTLKRPVIDLYSYNEYYETDAGTATPIMGASTAIMGSTQARCVQHFGAIKDLKATTPVKWFPKSWEEEDPSAQILLLQSAPLVAPHQIDAFLHATVHS